MITKSTVSICMITFNHENYIREAIEGVLMQICDFEIELIVSNDCSSDSTDSVIQDILQNHSKASRINYINNKKNLGMMPNFIQALELCTGKYIALCEGDDYWTDPLKLQKQVDFLEENLEYGICFHNVDILEQEDGRLVPDYLTKEVSEKTNAEDLAKGNYIHTPSVLIRNNFELPLWFTSVAIGDWTLYMLQIKNQKIKKLNDKMAVYRIHSGGIWGVQSQESRNTLTQATIKLIYDNTNLDPPVMEVLRSRMGTKKKPSLLKLFLKSFSQKLSFLR